MRGKVTHWTHSYGFCRADGASEDTFIHISALPDGLTELLPGTLIEFDETVNPRNGRMQADISNTVIVISKPSQRRLHRIPSRAEVWARVEVLGTTLETPQTVAGDDSGYVSNEARLASG